MQQFLDTPVYYALASGNADLALGNEEVKYFPEAVSPFADFNIDLEEGFNQLFNALPPHRRILFARRNPIEIPANWKLMQHIPGVQFVYKKSTPVEGNYQDLVPLTKTHAEAMVQLASLTRPGPFDQRTIEFGNYHGIFSGNQLVAMTGRRLHVYDYMEVSAVCTHPAHLGNGYAGKLLDHQVNSILAEQHVPFLHVREDNERAIALYERSGFQKNGTMHFYFLQKQS